MPHPKDDEIFPIDTTVRLKKTGEFAIIKHHDFQFHGRGFLNYRGVIEGRGEKLWALYHDDLELEVLPPKEKSKET
jgi:hypothetical protein